MAQGKQPKITWGTAFANTIEIGIFDSASGYPRPREGSEWTKAPSGSEDAWLTGVDYFLEGDARWIPPASATAPLVATGWDPAAGWTPFLVWMWNGNQARWYGDKTVGSYKPVYLVSPRDDMGAPSLEQDATHSIHIVLRAADGLAFVGY